MEINLFVWLKYRSCIIYDKERSVQSCEKAIGIDKLNDVQDQAECTGSSGYVQLVVRLL